HRGAGLVVGGVVVHRVGVRQPGRVGQGGAGRARIHGGADGQGGGAVHAKGAYSPFAGGGIISTPAGGVAGVGEAGGQHIFHHHVTGQAGAVVGHRDGEDHFLAFPGRGVVHGLPHRQIHFRITFGPQGDGGGVGSRHFLRNIEFV